jgi:hypothetical protein
MDVGAVPHMLMLRSFMLAIQLAMFGQRGHPKYRMMESGHLREIMECIWQDATVASQEARSGISHSCMYPQSRITPGHSGKF